MSEILGHLVKGGLLKLSQSALAFPKEIYALEGVRSLELDNSPISALPEGISQMNSLLKMTVLDGPLEQLPADLSKMKRLRWVFLRNTEFSGFPEELLEITGLKYFTWIEGLSDPAQTLHIPASFFKAPLSTVHLSQDNIDLPDSFFELETLESLTVSMKAALPYMDRIAEMAGLNRLQFVLDPDGDRDDRALTQALPTWQLKDKKYNSRTFVRR